MGNQPSSWRRKQSATLWRQANFAADQMHQVAKRLTEAGYVEMGQEFLTVANSASFFVEELERQFQRRGLGFQKPS
ncbi:hypothetical protein [Azospirillum sp. B4]|uniref:hypothetical protein n=1 Tax=Azospirillum sp. B4 TaxID=95605 RepID=UPI0011DE4B75|nr:hypothetical protein [Azospirillum sp. B4]